MNANYTLNAIMALIKPESVYDIPGTTVYVYNADKCVARQMRDETDPTLAMKNFRRQHRKWLKARPGATIKARLGWDEDGDLCYIEDGLVSD